MRPELEWIEKIEKYLAGDLQGAEKKSFEERLAIDTELQEELRMQTQLAAGIDRITLTEELMVAKRSYHHSRLTRNLKFGGLGLGILALVATIYFAFNKPHEKENNNSPGSTYAGNNLPSRSFLINTGRDTVIETPAGIVMAIRANTFLDENGNAATGDVEIKIREALDPSAIMLAGLSTRSGDQLLETGGMFSIDATKQGRQLSIDQAKAIRVQVPADSVVPGMQVFKGERNSDGNINWVNPRPLSKELSTREITTLDFYPPGYLDSLASWGHDVTNKKFTDSLYYSFATAWSTRSESEIDVMIESSPLPDSTGVLDHAIDTSTNEQPDERWGDAIPCAINPSKIRAIWNETYNNSNLATSAFEERLRIIHTLAPYDRILDVYIANLDKELWVSDSIAAKAFNGIHAGIFNAFAARRDGRAAGNSPNIALLQEYYQKKSEIYTEAVSKTYREYIAKKRSLDDESEKRRQDHLDDSLDRATRSFKQEFELNLKEAYRQLGYDSVPRPLPPAQTYSFEIQFTGWYNVDRYVFESTTSRSTLNYTDPQSGKKASIKYEPVSINVKNHEDYDRLYVYILPKSLNSFMRIKSEKGNFTENLNELLNYSAICIGYKGESIFFASIENLEAETYHPELSPIDVLSLTARLDQFGADQSAPMIKELEYLNFKRSDQVRRAGEHERERLRIRTARVIFPCLKDLFHELL